MIWSRTGGSDSGPLLVLLPGLGTPADVFTGVERGSPLPGPAGGSDPTQGALTTSVHGAP